MTFQVVNSSSGGFFFHRFVGVLSQALLTEQFSQHIQ